MAQTFLMGDPADDIREKLNIVLSTEFINVTHPDFTGGTVINTNVNDASPAIMAAIDYAFTRGMSSGGIGYGSKLWFPPGRYACASRINNMDQSGGNLEFIGSGFKCTSLEGSMNGFLLDKPHNQQDCVKRIEGLSVKNYSAEPGSGAIRMDGNQQLVIQSCGILGYNGIQTTEAAYMSSIISCELTATVAQAGVGIIMGQGQAYVNRCQSFGIGFQVCNLGCSLIGNSTEVCGTGIVVGQMGLKAFRASFSGTTMTVVDNWMGALIRAGDDLVATGVTGASVVDVIPPTGTGYDGGDLEGNFTIDTNVGTLSERTVYVYARTETMAGFTCLSHQTEQCDTGMDIVSVSTGFIASFAGTATVGPTATTNTLLTWNANVATVTSPDHGFVTGRKVRIAGVTPTNYNGDYDPVTRIDDDTFTYALPLGGDPGDSSVHGLSQGWARYGIRVGDANGLVIAGSSGGSNCDTASIDLTRDSGGGASTSPLNVVLLGVTSGSGWIGPPGNSKAGYRMEGCGYEHTLLFNDLPGTDTPDPVYNQVPRVGEPWTITNGGKSGGGDAVPGDTVAEDNTTPQKLIVAWNGTVWKCVAALT